MLAERKAKYVAPEPNIKTGWLSRYARMVTSHSRFAPAFAASAAL